MSAGAITAMISSLKSNNRLRRNKEGYSKFYKKKFSETNIQALTKEENRIIVEENKRKLEVKNKNKRKFSLLMIVFYGSIIIYGLYVFLE